ncbi:MAG: murein biosynthesis integral membrane protein MurJ [Clostridiales bacterium]|nr:murein biosynthesis integral membrane protein MurJ [Clostridiales bacterium]
MSNQGRPARPEAGKVQGNRQQNAGSAASSGKKGGTRTRSIAFSTVIMIIGLFFSKGSSFLRNILVAHVFDNTYRDAFIAAFLIPDFFFALLVGGSIQSAITPTLSRAIEQKTLKKTWKGVSVFVTLMSIVLLVAILFGEIFSGALYNLFYQGKNPDVVRLAGNMARTLYPQIFFMMLAALCIGVLNAYKKFGSTAFGPTIYNIGVLIAIFFLGASNPSHLYMTGVGIMAAAMVFFIFQLYMGRREVVHYKPSVDTHDPEFRRLFKLAVPILISASIVQINMLLLNSFASRFDEGSIYALNNASTLWQLPYGIFAVGIGNVMLPSLAALYSTKKYKDAGDLLGRSIKNALFLAVPCAGIFLILRFDLVKAVYQWSSSYTDENAEMAAMFLIGYCASIILQSVIFILNQAYYAIENTRFPLFAGVVSMIVNFGLCYLFVSVGMGPMSITIAYSISCAVRLALLVVVYNRNKRLAPKNIRLFLVKSAVCLLVMMAGLYLIGLVPFSPSRKLFHLVWFGVQSLFGFVLYFATAFLLHMEELQAAYDKYIARFFRKKKPSSGPVR